MLGWGEHAGEIVMGLGCIGIAVAFVALLLGVQRRSQPAAGPPAEQDNP